jgi:hypothetical protein
MLAELVILRQEISERAAGAALRGTGVIIDRVPHAAGDPRVAAQHSE